MHLQNHILDQSSAKTELYTGIIKPHYIIVANDFCKKLRGTRMQKNPQTRKVIFWILTDFHGIMWFKVQLAPCTEISSIGVANLEIVYF